MGNQILTSQHPRWAEYIDKLSQIMTAHIDFESEIICSHDLKVTKRILETMPEIDVESSLEHIRSTHGKCDCSILRLHS